MVLVETPLYLLHIAKEVQTKFKEHLDQICDECGLKVDEKNQEDYDPNATTVVKVCLASQETG